MEVFVFNEQKDLVIHPTQVIQLAQLVVDHEGKKYDEVSIYFVDQSTISDMHFRYFQDPSPTDCISFPMDDEEETVYRLMGDVFVCPSVAIEYAKKHSLDPYKEISLYVIHGLLHLMGYDDLEPAKRREMRKAEKRQMEYLTQCEAFLRLKKR